MELALVALQGRERGVLQGDRVIGIGRNDHITPRLRRRCQKVGPVREYRMVYIDLVAIERVHRG